MNQSPESVLYVGFLMLSGFLRTAAVRTVQLVGMVAAVTVLGLGYLYASLAFNLGQLARRPGSPR